MPPQKILCGIHRKQIPFVIEYDEIGRHYDAILTKKCPDCEEKTIHNHLDPDT
jgi:hypothetical protein